MSEVHPPWKRAVNSAQSGVHRDPDPVSCLAPPMGRWIQHLRAVDPSGPIRTSTDDRVLESDALIRPGRARFTEQRISESRGERTTDQPGQEPEAWCARHPPTGKGDPPRTAGSSRVPARVGVLADGLGTRSRVPHRGSASRNQLLSVLRLARGTMGIQMRRLPPPVPRSGLPPVSGIKTRTTVRRLRSGPGRAELSSRDGSRNVTAPAVRRGDVLSLLPPRMSVPRSIPSPRQHR